MDTLYWTSLNLRDKIEPTQKLFFNKYSHRVQYYCPGGSYLRDFSKRFWGRPDAYLEHRIETQKNYRAVGSWYPSHRFNWTQDVQLEQIESARAISKIKHRIEEPNLAFYSTDEDTIKLVVDTIKHTDRILHLNIPNPLTLDKLNNNTVYMKRGTGYRYKVFIRDRWLRTDNIATSFITYLDHLDDQVKISKTVRQTLEKNKLFSSVWFYSNDLTFLPMLELIYPNCVLKVQTIEIIK